MEDPGYCPNIKSCKLVITPGFTGNEEQRNSYLQKYCWSGNKEWADCKRWIVKNKLNFCPDFVLPDTSLTPDEIIDKFDNENLN